MAKMQYVYLMPQISNHKKMDKFKNRKIEKYHFEEIVLILLILATKLSRYDDEDVIAFTEDIEGRITELFNGDFLKTIEWIFYFDYQMIVEIETLKRKVENLIKPGWHVQLKKEGDNIVEIRELAMKVLNNLGVKYIDPKIYSLNHLNVDW